MRRRIGRMRPWTLIALSSGAALTSADEGTEQPWQVVCNTDCEGVNTCVQKQLCVGEEVETGSCADNPPCPADEDRCPPVDCQWGTWDEWINDGVSGLCVHKRSFTPNKCGGAPCIGTVAETMYCDPVKQMGTVTDCKFTPWTAWGPCDPVQLQRTRSRMVDTPPAHGGRACAGNLTVTEPCGVRSEPVDCELSDWMAWSGCSHRCGGGQQLRIRSIKTQAMRGGKLCGAGSGGDTRTLQITRACNEAPCEGTPQAQDCLLGGWSHWSECHEDSNQVSREREVLRPAAHGGKACESELKTVMPCKVKVNDTVVDCKLSQWSPWTLCSRTCEGGQTQRDRGILIHAKNGGNPCDDSVLETMPCNDFKCSADPESLDCSLSGWTEWTACSADCGQGVQRRSRSVRVPASEGGVGCSDALDEARPCEDPKPCAQEDCEWGGWTPWSTCSRSCGVGYRSRNRTVAQHLSKGGSPCEALESTNEVEGCNTEPCYDVCTDGSWEHWAEWGECSRSCGGGVAWRSRAIAAQASPCGAAAEGESTEERKCGEEPCKGDVDCELSEWSGWGDCSASCDGVTTRTREIKAESKGAGKWCGENATQDLALEQTKSCNGAKNFAHIKNTTQAELLLEACGFADNPPVDCELDAFEPWSNCTKTCDGGQRFRKRKIRVLPKNGGLACEGALQETGVCGTELCVQPKDCVWDNWGAWGKCNRCDGQRSRSRKVAQHGNSNGEACKSGDAVEVEKCDECPRVKILHCVWGEWGVGDCSVSCGSNGWRKKVRELVGKEVLSADDVVVVGNVTGDDAHCEGSEVDLIKCEKLADCDEESCQPQDCSFTSWTDWTEPTSCDGLCRRERKIASHAKCHGMQCSGPLADTKACENKDCIITSKCEFGDWQPWSECSGDQTQRQRKRDIGAPAGYEGEACDGSLVQTSGCEDLEAADVADCVLSHWGSWSECSRKCGGGQQEKTRHVVSHAVNGGKPCVGELRVMRACNDELCGPDAADCTLHMWSEWMGCETDDVSRQARRVRNMSVARGDGRPCDGPVSEVAPCPVPVPVPCKWGEWAQWGECGMLCGGGQRFRTREVVAEARFGGEPCDGDLGETEACNQEPCSPDDCHVSPWSPWSECESNCGVGQQRRSREIIEAGQVGGNGCTLGLAEARSCEAEGPCDSDKDCQMDLWSAWSECMKADFCGIGHRKRTRGVAQPALGTGKQCGAVATEEVMPDSSCPGSCDAMSCVDGKWDEWSEWDECSVTCGQGGVQERRRIMRVKANECGKPAEGDSREWRSCGGEAACELEGPLVQQDCVFGRWTPWEPAECPRDCNGEQKRTRAIVRYSANGGRACEGSTSEVRRCNPGVGEENPEGCDSGVPVDCMLQLWSAWSSCSAQCGTGHMARQRIIAVAPKFSGKECDNPLEEIKECNASKPCVDWSVDCKFADWQEWTACNPMTGQKSRKRDISQMKVGFGQDCEGSQAEVRDCERQCQDRVHSCGWALWSMWSMCSTECGPEGRRTRIRQLVLGSAQAAAEPPSTAGAPAAPAGAAAVAVPAAAAASARVLPALTDAAQAGYGTAFVPMEQSAMPAAAPTTAPAGGYSAMQPGAAEYRAVEPAQQKDLAMLTRYSDINEQLARALSRQHQERGLAFVAGLVAVLALLGGIRVSGHLLTLRAERNGQGRFARQALVEPLADRVAAAQAGP